MIAMGTKDILPDGPKAPDLSVIADRRRQYDPALSYGLNCGRSLTYFSVSFSKVALQSAQQK